MNNNQVPLLLRFLWFVFVGFWLGGIVITIAWFACITVVGLPLGLWLFNRLPLVMTLKESEIQTKVVVRDGQFLIHKRRPDQLPLVIRFLYFVLIGWWLAAIWLSIAYGFTLSIIGMPIAFWMYNRVPLVIWLTEP